MKKKSSYLRAGSMSILWGVLAIMLCGAPSLHAEDIDDPVLGPLFVSGTTNLLTGASVSDAIYVESTGILNMYSGSIGTNTIWADPAGIVNIYGTNLAIDGAGLVTGTYEDESPIYFSIYGTTLINLIDIGGGGGEENAPPVAEAGSDIVVSTKDIASTIIEGTATDLDTEDSLMYRWLEGTVAFTLPAPVGAGGEAPLDLATILPQYLGIGIHTLTLEVSDGTVTVFDEMVLTIENTPPVAEAGPDTAVLTKNIVSTIIEGTATDHDAGDSLTYRWLEETVELAESAPVGAGGEAPLDLATVLPQYLGIGTHILTMEVSDGQEIVSDTMILTIEVQQIAIDIKPGSDDNAINLGSNGVIPVAILSSADFDATTLDPDSIFLAGAGVAVRGKGNKYLASEKDVNGDGLVDLEIKVETENLDPGKFQDGKAVLQVFDGATEIYSGSDTITIVPQ